MLNISIANISVGKRLFMGFGLVLLLTAGIGLVGWHYTRSMAAEFDSLYTDNLQSAVHLATAYVFALTRPSGRARLTKT